MASVTIKTQGVDLNGAELVNAATETSLREIIDILLGMKKQIGSGGGKGGKDKTKTAPAPDTKGAKAADAAMGSAAGAAGEFGDELKDAAKKSSLANTALAGMGKVAYGLGATLGFANGAVGLLAGGIGTLASGVGSAAKIISGFADGVLSLGADLAGQIYGDSPATISGFTGAVGDAAKAIPLFGGALSMGIGIISAVFAKFEELRETQFELSKSGMSFNNNLMQMQAAATSTGLSLKEFTGIITENKDNIAKFGGTMTQGATQFANLSKTIRTGYGAELQGMGISLKQVNDELPGMMALQAQGARVNNLSMADMAKSAVSLTKEFDVTAKLTGVSNKAQADALAKKTQDAAFQLKLSQMDANEKEKLNKAMARAQSEFGDAGANAVKRLAMGMPALTDEQRALEAAAPGFISAMKDNVDKAQDVGVKTEDYGKTLDSNSRKGSAALAKAAKDNETAIYAGAAGLPGLGNTLGNMLTDSAKGVYKYMDKDGKFHEEKLAEDQAAARAEQGARDDVKGGLDDFDSTMRNLKDVLMNQVIQPLVKFITPAITFIAGGLTKFVNFISGLNFGALFGDLDGNAKKVGGQLQSAGQVVSDNLKDMGIDMGAIVDTLKNFDLNKTLKSFGINFEGIFSNSKEMFSTALTELGPGLKTLGGGLVESGKLAFVTARDFFKDIMEGIDFKGIGTKSIAFGKEILADINEIFVEYLQPLFERIAATIRVAGPLIGPIINDLADVFMAFYGIVEKVVKTVLDIIMPVVKPIANLLIDSFVPFVELLGGLVKVVKGILTGDLSTIGEGMKQIWGAFTDQIKVIGVTVSNILNTLDPIWKGFKVGWTALMNGLENIGDFFARIPKIIEKFISDSAFGDAARFAGLIRSKEEIAKDEEVAQKEAELRQKSRDERMAAAQAGFAGSTFGTQGNAMPAATAKAAAAGGAAAGSVGASMTSGGGGQTPPPPGAGDEQAQGGGGSKPQLATIRSKSGKSTAVAADAQPAFQRLIDYLDGIGYPIQSLGGYVDRDVRGRPGVKSVHAKGGAIDINPATNPLSESELVTDMPAGIQGTASAMGLGWGGAWKSRKDAMHFSASKHEGGSLMAKEGGMFEGPDSGYPVVLHGKEIVVPTDPEGMAKLSQVMGPYVAERLQKAQSTLGKSFAPNANAGKMLDKDFGKALSSMMGGNASQFVNDMFGKAGLPSGAKDPASQISMPADPAASGAGKAADPALVLSKTLDSLNSTLKELPKSMGSNKEMTDMLSEMVNQMKKNVDVSTKIHRAVN